MKKESITTNEYTYTAIFKAAKEGGYTVTCPALPGVLTEGDTLEEARMMVKEAIECHLESLQKDGLSIPAGDEHEQSTLREEIKVELQTT